MVLTGLVLAMGWASGCMPAFGSEIATPVIRTPAAVGYPRLIGMNIARDWYDRPEYLSDLAKLDIVIISFPSGWNPMNVQNPEQYIVRAIKKRNPSILVGLYTVLSEAQDHMEKFTFEQDKSVKLSAEKWWLRDADGRRVQWTAEFDAWEIDITEWARPDANGMRYPEWLAKRDFARYFGPTPEFDIWYFDNVQWRPRVKTADWDLDGKNDSGENQRIRTAFRRAMLEHWQFAKRLAPDRLQMGNTDNDLSYAEYKDRLQGAFLEGMMGYDWSLESWGGWTLMMERYFKVFGNLSEPRIVGFNVTGSANDYRLLRYALASCLLNDGYFSYTDKAEGYGSVLWFDEYDIDLGRPIEPPSLAAWQEGIHKRAFENGMVLVNPTLQAETISNPPGYRRFRGKQAPDINNGEAAIALTIGPKDGIILLRDASTQTIGKR